MFGAALCATSPCSMFALKGQACCVASACNVDFVLAYAWAADLQRAVLSHCAQTKFSANVC